MSMKNFNDTIWNRTSDLPICSTAKIKMYRIIILPVVLYGCETWSLTLREERRVRVFENRVLRRIFGPKRNEVIGKLRKLHNEELNDLYYSPHFVRLVKYRRVRWAGHVARMGDRKGVYRVVNLAEDLWELKCTIIVSKHLHKTTLIYTTRVFHLRQDFHNSEFGNF